VLYRFSLSFKVEGDMKKNTSNQQSPARVASILQLLEIVTGNTSLTPDLYPSWGIREFQPGEDLNGDTEDGSNFVYLICEGQVRLWGFHPSLGREVSTQLLVAGQTFGGYNFFCHQILPYRAIAVSAGCAAQITISDLQRLSYLIPNLESDLQQLIYQQQALIFFKTHTELALLSSSTLQEFLPYLVALKITAGSSLVQATGGAQGRFWLAGGKIDNSQQIGDSWKFPDDAFTDGIAQTDLLVYYLSVEYWECVKEILPQLFPQQAEVENQQIHNPQIIQIPLPVPQGSEQPNQDFDAGSLLAASVEEKQPKSKSNSWPSYPFIQQQSSSDSGVACLAMISQYWGKEWGVSTLRNLARVDSMGVSVHGLAAAADNLGYDVLTVRTSLQELDGDTNPWIAQCQENHYVVVWQVQRPSLLISDPAVGKRWLSLTEFAANWTGYAVLLNPTQRFHTFKGKQVSLSRYWDTLGHYRKLLGQIILASMLMQVIGLATPMFSQVVIDQVMPLKDFDTLNIFAISFFCLGVWRIVLVAQRQYLWEYVANRIDMKLIGRFINYTLQLPLQFFALRSVEDIVNLVEENGKIQLFLTRKAVSGTIDALMVVIYLGLMASYNWQLTFLVLVWMLLMVIVSVVSRPFLKEASRQILRESVGHKSSLREMIAGIFTVKTLAVESFVQMHWQERFQNMLKVRLRGGKLASSLELVKGLMNQLGSMVILWFGVNLVISQQISLGKFVAFNLLMSNIAMAVLALVELWDEYGEVRISVEELEDVFSSAVEENSLTPLLVMPSIQGEVQFDDVFFGYNPDEDGYVLQNISFQVKPHQTIGIVGRSGSGKSSLVNLLAGLYRPDKGKILIDGQDISLVSPQWLRSQLGFVGQECFLFSGTILENITLYSSEFSMEQAMAAAQVPEAHNFIEALPLGYKTLVGETGVRLSCGQKQKVAIARALIRKPAILILDEATSSLDAESEQRLHQNLARMGGYSTTFIISHRLSSVRHADCILVLDRGVLVEQGTHEELMAKAGVYHDFAQLQLQV